MNIGISNVSEMSHNRNLHETNDCITKDCKTCTGQKQKNITKLQNQQNLGKTKKATQKKRT